MVELGGTAHLHGDLDAAEQWYEQAAALGNAWAMNALGAIAEERGDTGLARTWWEQAVAIGSTAARINLELVTGCPSNDQVTDEASAPNLDGEQVVDAAAIQEAVNQLIAEGNLKTDAFKSVATGFGIPAGLVVTAYYEQVRRGSAG